VGLRIKLPSLKLIVVKHYAIYERKVEETIKKLGPKPSYSQKPSLWLPGKRTSGQESGWMSSRATQVADIKPRSGKCTMSEWVFCCVPTLKLSVWKGKDPRSWIYPPFS
jgi:hypothetical protein